MSILALYISTGIQKKKEEKKNKKKNKIKCMMASVEIHVAITSYSSNAIRRLG